MRQWADSFANDQIRKLTLVKINKKFSKNRDSLAKILNE
jgi:hypothetical protein